MPAIAMDPVERFNRAWVQLDNGCREWQLSVNIKDGYAQFSTSRTGTARAAVWAWKQFVGPIPDDMTIEHMCHTNDLACPGGLSCRHRRCVNWEDCLTLISRGENTARSRRSAEQRGRTHCPAQHEYNEENTWIYRNQRSCRTCNYARSLGLDPQLVPTLPDRAEMKRLYITPAVASSARCR